MNGNILVVLHTTEQSTINVSPFSQEYESKLEELEAALVQKHSEVGLHHDSFLLLSYPILTTV